MYTRKPSVLKAAVYELFDTEKMIAAAEKLYGPYRWERYDVIFLPSSFPFGGMGKSTTDFRDSNDSCRRPFARGAHRARIGALVVG